MESKNILEPIILDLGKEKRKNIKRLKRGEGKLSEEVRNAVHMVTSQMEGEDDNVKIVPVVIVYEKKYRKRKFSMPMPFPFKF